MGEEHELNRLPESLPAAQEESVREQEALELKVLEGLNSPTREMSGKEWTALRQSLRKKLTNPGKAG